eukprot:2844784-Prymnesium_polylepis.1
MRGRPAAAQPPRRSDRVWDAAQRRPPPLGHTRNEDFGMGRSRQCRGGRACIDVNKRVRDGWEAAVSSA